MNKNASYVEIELDKPRKLLYDLNAMAGFEKETGKSFLDLSKEKMTATLIRAILWAGLIHEDKALTVEKVGSLITPSNMLDIQDKVMEAQTLNMPKAEGGSESPNAETPPSPRS